METIRVNMTPCEDIKTIHASQNDNEAREWGFELHNNGEKIDSSSISDQLVFKAYEGGTEEILPTNGSTPTTSPFKGDIKYPQGLLSDQEFLYRESPTEEDGLAKITDIKGNTIVWNQVAPSMSSSAWVQNRCTKTVSGNTFTLVGTNHTSLSFGVYIALTNLKLTVNHNYLFMCVVNTNRGTQIRFTFDSDIRYTTITPNKDNVYSRVVSTATEDPVVCYVNHPSSITTSDTATIKNLMIVDLTMLNDSRVTDYDSFRTYYPLDYYAYNQGTLLSFMGNGIKTVGKNIFDGVLQNGTIDQYGQEQSQANRYRSGFIRVFPSTRYVLSVDGVIKNVNIFYYDTNKNFISSIGGSLVTTPSNCAYMRFYYDQSILNVNLQLEMLKSGDSPTPYEPYKESALSLPISTYFPNGMDGINDARDEKNETGYAKKIGVVDLGSLTWNRSVINDGYAFVSGIIANMIPTGNVATANVLCAKYTLSMGGNGYYMPNDKTYRVGGSYFGTQRVIIRDGSYTDATAFKTAMAGVPLLFELQTPLENYGVVDLGSLTWAYSTQGFFLATINDIVQGMSSSTVNPNVVSDMYVYKGASGWTSMPDMSYGFNNTEIRIKNTAYNTADAFKSAMSGVYLLYEKENPQGFTTATLVTENGEVALANENGVLVGKCNSDVSADAGFIEGKIKLSDENGDVYSNKIQIHVERSPQ